MLALEKNITYLESLVKKHDEVSTFSRVFRNNTSIRKQISAKELSKAVRFYVPEGNEFRSIMLNALSVMITEESNKMVDASEETASSASLSTPRTTSTPEVDLYLSWLTLILLSRSGHNKEVGRKCFISSFHLLHVFFQRWIHLVFVYHFPGLIDGLKHN